MTDLTYQRQDLPKGQVFTVLLARAGLGIASVLSEDGEVCRALARGSQRSPGTELTGRRKIEGRVRCTSSIIPWSWSLRREWAVGLVWSESRRKGTSRLRWRERPLSPSSSPVTAARSGGDRACPTEGRLLDSVPQPTRLSPVKAPHKGTGNHVLPAAGASFALVSVTLTSLAEPMSLQSPGMLLRIVIQLLGRISSISNPYLVASHPTFAP